MSPRSFAWAGVLIVGLGAAPVALPEDFAGATPRLEVVGTTFHLTLSDGRVLAGRDLMGVIIDLGDVGGRRVAVRIDDIKLDPRDPSGETTLYGLMVQNATTGSWVPLCRPDAYGIAMGFPLAGRWTPAGEFLAIDGAVSLTCTSGASAKCVRLGYKPWKTAVGGASLHPYFEACVRMMRADYCGDGTPHTHEGIAVAIRDGLGIHATAPVPGMSFEAAWGPDGAVCVRRTRVPQQATLQSLAHACPERLADKIGDACGEAEMHSGEALMINASQPFGSDLDD